MSVEESLANGEFLRLPRGFSVRSGRSFDHYIGALNGLRRAARLAGLESLLLTAVSFASTFNRVSGITGEKTFEFADRKGRRLILAPDSSPAVLRWHLEGDLPEKPSRTAWFAPVFRYRRQQNRGFHQFGISFVNEPLPLDDGPDYQLAEIVNILLDLLRSEFALRPVIRLTNVGAIRRLLMEMEGEHGRAEELLTALHFCGNSSQAAKLVLDRCQESTARDVLLAVLSAEFGGLGASHARANVGERYNSIIDEMRTFGALLRPGVAVELSPWNLHSSQILSGIGVQLLAPDGRRLGDGGRYDRYAKNFHDGLFSFISISSGVEGVARHSNEKDHAPRCDISVLSFADCLATSLPLVESLRSAGITARLEVLKNRIGQARKIAAKVSTFFTVIGRSEVTEKSITLIHGESSQTTQVTLSELPTWLTRSLARLTAAEQ